MTNYFLNILIISILIERQGEGCSLADSTNAHARPRWARPETGPRRTQWVSLLWARTRSHEASTASRKCIAGNSGRQVARTQNSQI